jgi:hypothetical protein
MTDIGIELSRLLYRNSKKHKNTPRIVADRSRLILLLVLAFSFLIGGISGAVGFKHVGYKMTVPLAIFLLILALRPLVLELRIFFRHLQRDLDPK